jgi:aminopeptidase N
MKRSLNNLQSLLGGMLLPAMLLLTGNAWLNGQLPHHAIHAVITPSTGEITVTDSIIFPEGSWSAGSLVEFTLNGSLVIEKRGGKFRPEQLPGDSESSRERYRISLPPGKKGRVTFPVTYSGRIQEAIAAGAAEYARGFSSTDGIISPEGVYLAGSSGWLPALAGIELFTFTLTVETDETWNVVTQGTRTVNMVTGNRRLVRYNSPDPVDQVYLVAGPWTEYSVQSAEVLVQAFLRSPDEELASRYLGATGQYLALYNDMIGPYPYTKFALVENFWETGFGMPSFTLLGEKVIRFPWILYSSYPHELLHNYWGNSVYVDYSQGNWCEGITAYMADHLIKEQQGQDAEYRRTVLQKFTDYVNPENDFPPSEFTSRNNPAGEAIGYGKVMMFNNMLRDGLGDDVFRKAYADFYANNRFRLATWDDIRTSFERVTGKDLQPVFDQWIKRKGAPTLQLADVSVTPGGEGYDLAFTIRQVQDEDPFDLDIPVSVYLEDQEEPMVTRFALGGREGKTTLHTGVRPLKVSVDPQFNLMRRLHYSEVPTSLSQLFGAQRSAIILPSMGAGTSCYKELAEMWRASQEVQGKELVILYDTAVAEIPADMPVWVAGFGNRFYDGIRINRLYQDLLPDEVGVAILELSRDQTLVYAIPNNINPVQTIGFIGTHSPSTIEALARKLPHYGGYGYLGFTGSEFTNVLKGGLPVLNPVLEKLITY